MQPFMGRSRASAAALALAAALAAPPALAQTGGAAPVAALDPAATLRDNLAKLASAKQRAEVTLKGGKSFRGRVGAVGDHGLLLTEIEGRELYDVWIALDEVAAVEVRARGQ
jgi:hypothetical protein